MARSSSTLLAICRSFLYLSGVLCGVVPGAVTAAEIAPFTSDGCSAFPDGTIDQNQLWLNCCTEHDRTYWMGGTREDRTIADQVLKDCVASVGHPHIAELMLAGVRVGDHAIDARGGDRGFADRLLSTQVFQDPAAAAIRAPNL